MLYNLQCLCAVQEGFITVLSTNNNTLATLSDAQGNVKAFVSAGKLGFKNSRKATPHAAEAVGAQMGERVSCRCRLCLLYCWKTSDIILSTGSMLRSLVCVWLLQHVLVCRH
jgi:hypothetical protein